MTTPPQHGKPKKRTQFGRVKRPRKPSPEEQQRKVEAWLKFLKP